MTKAEEITLFRDFCEKLPANSYLASILQGVPDEVERMIQNDWDYSLAGRVDDLLAERDELQNEISKLRQHLAELSQQMKDLKRNLMWAEQARSSAKAALHQALQVLQQAS